MAKRLKVKTNIIREEYYTISSEDLAKELGIKLKDNQYLDCRDVLNSDDIIIYVKDKEYVIEEEEEFNI